MKGVNNRQKARYFNDEGVVLVAQTLGEADKILTIFTKEYGKLEILAKNIKKMGSRRAPACDILSYSKFAITKNKVDSLSEVVNISQLPKIKADLIKLSQAFIAAEVLNLITPVGVPNPTIFDAFLDFLAKLSKTANLHEAKVVRAAFQVKLLTEAGWLGKDFQISNFAKFSNLDQFLTAKFESIFQKRLKSAEFANMIVRTA